MKLKEISKKARSSKLPQVVCLVESQLNRVQSPICLVLRVVFLAHKQNQQGKEHCSNPLQVALLEANRSRLSQLREGPSLVVLQSLLQRAVYSAILVKSRNHNQKRQMIQNRDLCLVIHHFPSQLDHSLVLLQQVEVFSELAQVPNQVAYSVHRQAQIFSNPSH